MSSTDNLLNAVIFVLALNAIMFIAGQGIAEVGGINPFNYSDNALSKFNTGTEDNPEIPTNSSLPSGIQAVEPDTGGFFTDIFSSISTWFVDKLGLGWILSILSGPKIILGAMGVPVALAWALTALWYGVTLLIIVSYMFGR